mmetsp:Transcript_28760/g.57932  ORF Transcript_28760/g.57932 Transcript_28760/m.57932 type:complete len:212 (+) Transcript_28760:41-676(+)
MTTMSAANMMMRGGIIMSRRSLVACSSAASRSLSTLPSRYDVVTQLHAHQTTNYNHQRHHLFSTKTRRRRRGGASLSNDRDLSPQQFLSVANDLLDKVESSVLKLKNNNEGIEVTRHPASSGSTSDADGSDRQHLGQLEIKVPSIEGPYEGGTYMLTINADNNVALQCLSGNFTYVYNTVTSEWVGQEDGHSLLGILTRDWIRQCHGVPDF